MYRCDVCNKVQPAGTPQVRLVVDTREKTYDITPHLSEKEKKKARRRGINVDQGRQTAQGWEIVKEIVVCPDRRCLADRPDLVGALEAQLEAHQQRKLGVRAEAGEAGEEEAASYTAGPPAE